MIITPSAARLLGTGPTSSIPIPTTTSVVQPDNPVIILTYVIPRIQPLYDTPSPYHTMSYSTGQSWRKIVCLWSRSFSATNVSVIFKQLRTISASAVFMSYHKSLFIFE